MATEKKAKKEVHPKSPQGEKEEKIFKRDKKKDERPVKAALKGLNAKINPDPKGHKKNKVG